MVRFVISRSQEEGTAPATTSRKKEEKQRDLGCCEIARSHPHNKMQTQVIETRTNQGLPSNGARVHFEQ